MGIVEEKEQQRKTRRKEAEQEEGIRRKEADGEGGGQARRQEGEAKKRRQKLKVEKVLVEEEAIVCQGPLMVTKVPFHP